MAHRDRLVDAVVVAPPHPLALDVPGVDEVCEHAVRLALGEAHASGDLADGRVRRLHDLEQHEAVGGEEGPGGAGHHTASLYGLRDVSPARATGASS